MKKNPFLSFGLIFSAIGLPLLILAGFLIFKDIVFMGEAVKTQGTVIELVEKISRERKGTSRTYYPKVSFVDDQGKEVIFTSDSGSNPPGFSEGEEVAVLYDPSNSNEARIDTFFQAWGGSFIVGLLGLVFSAVGVTSMAYAIRKKRMKEWLLAHGKEISAEVKSIGLNTMVIINGQSPWQIVAQWVNPNRNVVYTFKSEYIWFDPAQFVKDKTIKVFIDSKNPKHYYMDISFLPKEGN